MTNTNPLDGFLSDCCGAEHDINAEHHILNESIRGGCSVCGHYSEFSPAENSEDQKEKTYWAMWWGHKVA